MVGFIIFGKRNEEYFLGFCFSFIKGVWNVVLLEVYIKLNRFIIVIDIFIVGLFIVVIRGWEVYEVCYKFFCRENYKKI